MPGYGIHRFQQQILGNIVGVIGKILSSWIDWSCQ